MSTPRTLAVGSREYVTAILRESGGQDLSAVDVEIAVTPLGRRALEAQWREPDLITRTPAGLSASLLVDAALRGSERVSSYSVWLRVRDEPEVLIVHAGSYTVK